MRVRMYSNSRRNIAAGLSFLFIVTFLLFFQGSAVNSNEGNFSVAPSIVYFNWTFGPITITSNVNNSYFGVQNQSTAITPQYYVSTPYTPTVTGLEYDPTTGKYIGFDSANNAVCFTGGMDFIVQNNAYTNVTGILNQTNSTVMNITAYQFCPPGYYNGTFNVTQNGTTDWANVTAAVNIPVNPANTFYEPNSTAFVKGTILSNSNLTHKYYFNTGLVQNLTGVTINLSGQTEDIDLYLFNSTGTLLARSVENGSANEEINSRLPATPDVWSFWIVGNTVNATNYLANMYFTTLNVINGTGQNVNYTVNFGSLDAANNQSTQVNITLNNTDTRAWNGVSEKSEIYRTDVWNNRSAAGDYYFLVPSFATKLKVKIEWKGGTRWTISLNDSNANFWGNSSRKYLTGNLTNTTEEESVLYTGAINTNNDGLWKITIGNLTAAADNYNVTAQVWVWVDSAAWLNSTFPLSGFNFNPAGAAQNTSLNVSLKINLPLPNITKGNYSGFVDYYYPGQWNTRIPISFTVKAGTLFINNSLYSVNETKYDNRGFNRIGVGALWTNLTLNNTGDEDVYFANFTSNGVLSVDGTHNMSFTVQWPSNLIPAGSSATINISTTINTTNTDNTLGLYTGYILLNTTNSTSSNSSSYPFDSLFIYLNVILSRYVNVSVTGITPIWIATPANATNMTFNVSVLLANGTKISTNTWLNQSNFNANMVEANASLTTSALTGLTNSAGSGTWSVVCPVDASNPQQICAVNGTLASGVQGGIYYGTAGVTINTTNLGGTGESLTGSSARSATLVTINDTGVKITGDTITASLYVDQTEFYRANITNYGPLPADNVAFSFNKGSCPVTAQIQPSGSNCMAANQVQGASSSIWNASIPAYMEGSTNCTLVWKITATAVTDYCTMSISVVSAHSNYGSLLAYVEVLANTTSGSPGAQQGQQQSCTSNITCPDTQYCRVNVCTSLTCLTGWTASGHKCNPTAGTLNITDYTEKIYILQGSSNSSKVTVKNMGGVSYTVKLDVTNTFAGLTPGVSPSSYTLGGGNSGIFTVSFNVSSTAEIGLHTVTIKTYANENASIYKTKDVTVVVLPLEETKAAINQSEIDLKNMFANITAIFNAMPPSAEANYTLTNRTYTRLLNMFQDIESSIRSGDYLTANSLLKDANSSLAEFKQQVSQLSSAGAGGLLAPLGVFGSTVTLVAIFVVIIVIGSFLAYLLLPSKKGGFHPSIGYVPKEKASMTSKLKHLFSRARQPGSQKSLAEFERKPIVPATAATAKPPDKKTYPEGFNRLDQFPLSYEKDKFKEKK
jgi:hypothetical protein